MQRCIAVIFVMCLWVAPHASAALIVAERSSPGVLWETNASPLSITNQPSDLTVVDGQGATFSVSASGPGLTYQWWMTLPGKSGPGTIIDGETSQQLTLPGVIYTFHNARTYWCVITDSNGDQVVSRRANLTVTPVPPSFVENLPANMTILPGSTITLMVAAQGTLPLSYTWTRQGTAGTICSSNSFICTSPILSAGDDGAVYQVQVTNGANQSTYVETMTLSVNSNASNVINVDVTKSDADVAHHVGYRRGIATLFDSDVDPQALSTQIQSDYSNSGINLFSANINFNNSSNEDFFTASGSPPTLTAQPIDGVTRQQFSGVESALANASVPPLPVVQVSGTPQALSGYLDSSYKEECDDHGNFYPLPDSDVFSTTQVAVTAWLKELSKYVNNDQAIYIGTQEPTHTLGFHDANAGDTCTNPTSAERQAGLQTNIDRFIPYWSSIAAALKQLGMQVGGIQLNSADQDLYESTAVELIKQKVPVDYYTLQIYDPSSGLDLLAHDAYERFQTNPAYSQTKIFFDRYTTEKLNKTTPPTIDLHSPPVALHFLQAEADLMPYAEMMAGYALQDDELEGRYDTLHTSLVPGLVKFLQAAPTPLRPITSTTSDLHAFALVHKGTNTSAYLAIWNVGSTHRDIQAINLNGMGDLSGLSLTVWKLDTSSHTVAPVQGSQGISVSMNTINHVSLDAGDFVLLSLKGSTN